MNTNLRPAFYALPSGAWRDYMTLLHFPYTTWHLSYVLLGSAAAPEVHLDRVGWVVLAFFLAVGLGAHSLDELHGRPLQTKIPDVLLLATAAMAITGAVCIGLYASLAVSLWALPFVIFGGFIVVAYNLELFEGRFHSDIWFGLAWGGFPALVGYWANAEHLSGPALAVSAACIALSLAQRSLSNRARGIRRSATSVTGRVEYRDGSATEMDAAYLLAAPETALRWTGAAVALLALGALASRV